jgi:two-component system, OmpR family, sensor histidine kinase KdpD
MKRMFFRLKSKLRKINPYFASAVLIALAVLLAWNLPEETALSTVAVLLLMSVLACAATWGLRPGLLASLCAGLALDYFFIPPIYSFNIDDWRNGFSWFIFEFSAIVVCLLSERLRQSTRAARREKLLARRLHAMSQRLFDAKDVSAIARITVSALGAALGARVVSLTPAGHIFEMAAHPAGTPPNSHELEAAMRQYKNGCGKTNIVFHDGGLTCKLLPMGAASRRAAVIVIGPTARRLPGFQDRARIIGLFSAQGAAAFERVALSREIEDVRIAAGAEKLRSALLTSISHDLKTPLSIILGSASSLQALRTSISQKSAQELLESILDEGQRLDRFIANLLDMSRVEAEAVRPKCEAIDLADVLGSALERASRVLAHHHVVLNLPRNLPQLELDPVITERVLFNVLDNAAKYTPEESQVTLTAEKHGAFVNLRIADEGGGIPEKELPYLFDKFYRVDTGDFRPPGTGLGLAICRGFLEAMGGSISASSRRDRRGAVFTISLPISSPGAHAMASGGLPQNQQSLEAL